MQAQYYHFSIDDVFNCLFEVSRAPELILEHHFFRFLQQLHEDYHARVNLYAFLSGADQYQGKNLGDVSSQLKEYFQQAPWLLFGPHAINRATPPHAQPLAEQLDFCQATYRQLERFAGAAAFSTWVRFHYFSECYELAELLKKQRVAAILTTDKSVACYRLPPPQKAQLQRQGTTYYNGIEFVRSHIRVEDVVAALKSDDSLDDELSRRLGNADCAVIFTHEYELDRPEVRRMTRRIFDWVKRHRLQPIDTLPACPNTL